MTKAILFDFWGTLIEQGVKSPLRQVQSILDIRLPFGDYVLRMERAMMTRQFGELRDAFAAVAAEFGVEMREMQLDRLVGMWNKSWMLAQPYPDTIETLQRLRQHYTLALISNTDCFSLPKVMEKFGLKEHFHHVFLSYELGAVKTESTFLQHVLQTLQLPAEECILVGDSTESDMKAAELAGMQGILVDRRGTREYMPKIQALGELEGQL